MVTKILGDHTFSEFINDVRMDEILKTPTSFRQISTATSLALEMHSKGSERVMILGCLSAIVGGLNTECDVTSIIDRLRVIFDLYLMGNHDVYVCPPLGRHSERTTKITQFLERKFMVLAFNFN
jgi:hypothetical protein